MFLQSINDDRRVRGVETDWCHRLAVEIRPITIIDIIGTFTHRLTDNKHRRK